MHSSIALILVSTLAFTLVSTASLPIRTFDPEYLTAAEVEQLRTILGLYDLEAIKDDFPRHDILLNSRQSRSFGDAMAGSRNIRAAPARKPLRFG